jgi:hypothetical protein
MQVFSIFINPTTVSFGKVEFKKIWEIEVQQATGGHQLIGRMWFQKIL